MCYGYSQAKLSGFIVFYILEGINITAESLNLLLHSIELKRS